MASITGINADFRLDNASNVLTDISSYVSAINVSSDQETFTVKVFKATRAETVAGFTTETWEITGPWTQAANTFWEGVAGLAQGTSLDFQLGPQGTTAGQTKWTGTCTYLSYLPQSLSGDGVYNYTARLSILTKTTGTF